MTDFARLGGLSKTSSSGGGGGGGAATSITYEDYDASSGLYPTTYSSAAIVKGNQFIVTVASAADGNGDIKFPLSAILIARTATPGQIDANWKIITA